MIAVVSGVSYFCVLPATAGANTANEGPTPNPVSHRRVVVVPVVVVVAIGVQRVDNYECIYRSVGFEYHDRYETYYKHQYNTHKHTNMATMYVVVLVFPPQGRHTL